MADSLPRADRAASTEAQTVMWKRLVPLAGLPRSGTTWVGDVMGHASEATYIFEPFSIGHHARTTVSDDLGFKNAASFGPIDDNGALAERMRQHLQELVQMMAPDGVDTGHQATGDRATAVAHRDVQADGHPLRRTRPDGDREQLPAQQSLSWMERR